MMLDQVHCTLDDVIARLERLVRPEPGTEESAEEEAAQRDLVFARVSAALGMLTEAARRAEPAGEEDGPPAGFSDRHRRKLYVLRSLLRMPEPVITPELDPHAALGHSCPTIERELDLPAGEGLGVLEELADLGLLERSLFNHVHLCPECRRCQINFRETCPGCRSLSIEIERVVSHFHCAHSGLESQFAQGIHLVCPKCRRRLYQLGQDFERPHDTYVCRDCEHLFEEPRIDAQCLSCGHAFPGSQLQVEKVHRYRPTALTVRAIELDRLTGLDVSEVMFDGDLGFATRDFIELEAQREASRLRRHDAPFSGARLHFEEGGRPHPIFGEWSVDDLRELGGLLATGQRELDVIAKLDRASIGFLLPETDAEALRSVMRRLAGSLRDLAPTTRNGRLLEPRWRERTWSDPHTGVDDVLVFFADEEAPA